MKALMGGTTAADGTVRASSGSPAAPPCRGSGSGDGASRGRSALAHQRLHRGVAGFAGFLPPRFGAVLRAKSLVWGFLRGSERSAAAVALWQGCLTSIALHGTILQNSVEKCKT